MKTRRRVIFATSICLVLSNVPSINPNQNFPAFPRPRVPASVLTTGIQPDTILILLGQRVWPAKELIPVGAGVSAMVSGETGRWGDGEMGRKIYTRSQSAVPISHSRFPIPNTRLKQNFIENEINRKLMSANTRFSFKLFSQILNKQPNENVFISPASIAIALSMTYNGASGKTQQAMAKTLELQEISIQDVNLANAALRESLVNLDPQVQLSIANSLWLKDGEPFQANFVEHINQFYNGQVKNINFGDDSALSVINNWVNQSTNQKIEKIVTKEDIDPNTVFLLLNAISFWGTWSYSFPKEVTKDRPFILLDGTKKIHPMMYREKIYNLQYLENELFQLVSLPYGKGRLSMYIFLPNREISLSAFYQHLNAENWDKWIDQLNNNQDYSGEGVTIGLPRFKLEYEIDLKNHLKSLGMDIAFSNGADFSAMTRLPLFISFVKHKTFVEVNEEGTSAAAVTAVAATRSPGIQMIVDRPFFCAIRDNETGAILFMGSIVEPK